MARHEQNFCAQREAPLSLDELLQLLGPATGRNERTREDAIACYLSGGDGWREAVRILGGTFADEAGLRDHKAD